MARVNRRRRFVIGCVVSLVLLMLGNGGFGPDGDYFGSIVLWSLACGFACAYLFRPAPTADQRTGHLGVVNNRARLSDRSAAGGSSSTDMPTMRGRDGASSRADEG